MHEFNIIVQDSIEKIEDFDFLMERNSNLI